MIRSVKVEGEDYMHDYYKSDLRDYVTELLVYDFELDTLIVNLK